MCARRDSIAYGRSIAPFRLVFEGAEDFYQNAAEVVLLREGGAREQESKREEGGEREREGEGEGGGGGEGEGGGEGAGENRRERRGAGG